MAPPRFLKKRTGVEGTDRNLDSIQQSTEHSAKQIDYDRRLIEQCFLESNYRNNVVHGLKRVPVGIRVVASSVQGSVYLVESGCNLLTMELTTTASGVFDLECF